MASTSQGGTAEVGLIGREGVIGAFFLLGPAREPMDCFVQLEGTGLRISLTQLRKLFHESREIQTRILEFVQVQGLCLAQLAGCHRLHQAEERLARWLLMAQDRTQTDELRLTQEFLAMMLGARRTTMTAVTGAMQQRGLIENHRGVIKIPSRERLEAVACDCYQVIKGLYGSLYRHPVPD